LSLIPRWPSTAIRREAAALWLLAWPVLIGQVATVAMGVVDVAMTGHASAEDLAAVSLGASVWSIVIVTVMGILMSVNTLVAHKVGAGSTAQIPHLVRQALWKSLFIGGLAWAASNVATLLFDHIGLDPSVAAMATQFVQVISLGVVPFTAYRALYGYSASLGQTKPTMIIAVGALLYNIVVNWLLVFGNGGLPKLGAIGCAIATASGLWLMLFAMLLWIRRAPAYRDTYPFSQWEWPDWTSIGAMLKLGLPIGITYFAEVTAFASIALLVARFGVVSVAAHQIALNFSSLVFMVPLSFGIALVTRVGQTLGAGDPVQARFIAWVGVGMALLYALGSATLIAVLRGPIAAAYTSDVAVQALAAELLLFAAIFQLSDATQVATSCAIRGYKVTRRPMFIHLAAFWGLSLPLGCVLGFGLGWLPFVPAQAMQVQGFWVGLVVGLTVAALLLSLLLHYLSSQHLSPAGEHP
jgi:MATE family multidrug resistance protein